MPITIENVAQGLHVIVVLVVPVRLVFESGDGGSGGEEGIFGK
jgi:hypothetical protein